MLWSSICWHLRTKVSRCIPFHNNFSKLSVKGPSDVSLLLVFVFLCLLILCSSFALNGLCSLSHRNLELVSDMSRCIVSLVMIRCFSTSEIWIFKDGRFRLSGMFRLCSDHIFTCEISVIFVYDQIGGDHWNVQIMCWSHVLLSKVSSWSNSSISNTLRRRKVSFVMNFSEVWNMHETSKYAISCHNQPSHA